MVAALKQLEEPVRSWAKMRIQDILFEAQCSQVGSSCYSCLYGHRPRTAPPSVAQPANSNSIMTPAAMHPANDFL